MTTVVAAWLIAEYEPVSLFSLRPSATTAAGGQTLLVPTPYAVKLAVTDAVIRVHGEQRGRALFESVQSLDVRLRPPHYTVVTHTFNRVRWWGRGDRGDGSSADDTERDEPDPPIGGVGPWVTRIAYREYCFHLGTLQIAVDVSSFTAAELERLREATAMVTYFGKRGGFFQFIDAWLVDLLPSGFDVPASPPPVDLNFAQVQLLDDLPDVSRADLWDRVNSFSSSRVRIGEDRIVTRLRMLPVRRLRSSRTFTLYARTV